MPAILINPMNFVFHIPSQTLPLKDFPPGRHRFRFRPDEFATVIIKTPVETAQYYLIDHGTHWSPGPQKARNQTITL